MLDRENNNHIDAHGSLPPAATETAPSALTYGALLEGLRSSTTEVDATGVDSPVTRNRRTALRRFMQSAGVSETELVGGELSDDFIASLATYERWESRQGTATTTIRSRCSHLRHIQRHCLARPQRDAGAFATVLDRAIAAAGRPLTWLAKQSGICANSLSQWRRGLSTPGRMRKNLSRLETCLGLRAGELLDTLPTRAAHPTGYGAAERAQTTRFRENLRARMAERPFSLPAATEALKREWHQLLSYKTADLPLLHRGRRAKWRAKPARMCKPMRPEWACTLTDGRVCPSALAMWVQVRQFLGWLQLDVRQGGAGLAPDVTQTLARLADAQRIVAFVDWRAQRAGGLNMGALSFLNAVNSLLHPTTGWLTQSHWLSDAAQDLLRESGTSWAEHCARTFERLKAFTQTVAESARPTRDVQEALQPLLDTGDPVALLHQMLESMERDMPEATQPVRRAIHQRDIAMVTLLFIQPLRIGQLTALEYGPRTDRNLLRSNCGWRLQCCDERYKNGTTTMAKGLKVELDSSASMALDRYVREGRATLLAGRESRYFFVGMGRWDPATPCENLEDRLQILTRRYIPGCAGFRGHGWRHLLATAWLLEHPEDYATVADLLGDTVQTIERAYRHVERANSVKRFGEWARTKRR